MRGIAVGLSGLAGLSNLALPALCAVAGGGAYAFVMPNGEYAQFMTLMVFGLWCACVLHFLGLLRFAVFFAFGFSVIINLRKVFGMPPVFFKALTYGEARYQFLSFTDLALGVIVLLLALGQLPGEKRDSLPLPRWTLAAAAGFWIIALSSYFYAPDKGRAIAQMVFDAKLMAMVLVLARLFSDRRRILDWLPVIVYGMMAACVLEFLLVAVEYTNVIRFGPGVFMGVPYGMGLQERMLGVASMTRVSGTYGHANYLGVGMGCVALVAWELLLASRSILQRWRNIIWAAWGGVCAAFLLSLSRGAWVGLAAPAFLYFPCALKIQGRDWLKAFLKRYAAVSIFGVAVMLVAFWGPLEQRIFHSNPSAMEARRLMNNVSKNFFERNTYFGGGIGNHIALTENHPVLREASRVLDTPIPAHNTYLLVSTEIGVVGSFFYFMIPFSLFIMALRGCLKYADDPLAPVCLAFASSLIIFWVADCFSPVTRNINCAYMYWIMMGIAAGTLSALGEGRGEAAIATAAVPETVEAETVEAETVEAEMPEPVTIEVEWLGDEYIQVEPVWAEAVEAVEAVEAEPVGAAT